LHVPDKVVVDKTTNILCPVHFFLVMGFKVNKNFTVLTFKKVQIQGFAIFQMHKAINYQKWFYKAMQRLP